jgi:hypothetical protein
MKLIPILPSNRLIVAIDFDGTIVENNYPEKPILKKDSKDCIDYLSKELNAIIIIWTCRNSDKDIQEIKDIMVANDIHYDYINENCKEAIEYFGNDSRKICADCYIDDRNLGNSLNDVWKIQV